MSCNSYHPFLYIFRISTLPRVSLSISHIFIFRFFRCFFTPIPWRIDDHGETWPGEFRIEYAFYSKQNPRENKLRTAYDYKASMFYRMRVHICEIRAHAYFIVSSGCLPEWYQKRAPTDVLITFNNPFNDEWMNPLHSHRAMDGKQTYPRASKQHNATNSPCVYLRHIIIPAIDNHSRIYARRVGGCALKQDLYCIILSCSTSFPLHAHTINNMKNHSTMEIMRAILLKTRQLFYSPKVIASSISIGAHQL